MTTDTPELREQIEAHVWAVLTVCGVTKSPANQKAMTTAVTAIEQLVNERVAEAKRETAHELAHLYDGNGPSGPPTYGLGSVRDGWTKALGFTSWREGIMGWVERPRSSRHRTRF